MTETRDPGQPAPMQVLPLEWHRLEGALPPETIQSKGHLHAMCIWPNEKGSWTLKDGKAVSEHESEEDAKEAGRRELERRILQLVGPSPVVNDLVEALRGVVEAAHPDAGEVDRRLALQDARNAVAAWDKRKPVQAGNLDQGVPNYHDHTQRGFSPR
jgi:hypothetical protein